MGARALTRVLLALAVAFIALSFVPALPGVWMLVAGITAGGIAIFVAASRQ